MNIASNSLLSRGACPFLLWFLVSKKIQFQVIKLEWIMFIRIISFQMFSASLKKQDFLFCMKHMLFLLRKSPVLNISFLFFSFLTRVVVYTCVLLDLP